MFVDDARAMPFTREFCHQLAARGWLTLSWPAEHGGADGSVWQQAVVREEMWAAGEPRGPQYMNLNYIGPLIMRFGTPEQQARHLPRMAAGDVLWCQGFSEPEAGSDLASLKTRAVRDGDHYVVNGQKIWNSYADAPADHCLLLARTNTEVKKQVGISMFLVDMRTPGITVRPIPSMAGKSEFSEIFFDDAVIPAADRLGDEDTGLDAGGGGAHVRAHRHRPLRPRRTACSSTSCSTRATRSSTAVRSPTIRRSAPRLATLATRIEAAKLLNYGAISIQAAGSVPAIEASIARIHNTQVEQLAGQVGLEVLGPQGLLLDDDPRCLLDGEMQRQWLESIPVTVAAGTTEVQKNIIAQRGLGLPRSADGDGVMDLTLDDDQLLLAESARQLFERSYTTESSRDAETQPDGFSAELWKQAVELGWPGIALPEEWGGAGYGALELAVLAEELGRGAATLPLLSSYAATLPLLWTGSGTRRWSSGSLVSRRGRGSPPSHSSNPVAATSARTRRSPRPEHGDGWLVSGTKLAVPFGAVADLFVVSVELRRHGPALVVVDAAHPTSRARATTRSHRRRTRRSRSTRSSSRRTTSSATPRRSIARSRTRPSSTPRTQSASPVARSRSPSTTRRTASSSDARSA